MTELEKFELLNDATYRIRRTEKQLLFPLWNMWLNLISPFHVIHRQSWKSVLRALRVSVYVWCLGCGWFSSMIKCCTDGNLWYQLPANDCAVWLHYWEADPSESQWPCNHCHRYNKCFLSAWKPSKNVCSSFYVAIT